MKPNLSACSLLVAATALLPLTVCASPRAQAPSRQHKPSPAKPRPQVLFLKPLRPTGKAFILNAARPGADPNRGDHMAFGRGMHPEQMDHMNTVTPVPTVTLVPTAPDPPKR